MAASVNEVIGVDGQVGMRSGELINQVSQTGYGCQSGEDHSESGKVETTRR